MKADIQNKEASQHRHYSFRSRGETGKSQEVNETYSAHNVPETYKAYKASLQGYLSSDGCSGWWTLQTIKLPSRMQLL